MENHPINELITTTIQKVREMLDANTVVGEPIKSGDITLIPVSKISMGFASGGSDLPAEKQKAGSNNFGGGGGAGINITPIAFLIIHNDNVRLLGVGAANNTLDRIVDMVPGVVDKVSGMIDDKKKKKEDPDIDEDDMQD